MAKNDNATTRFRGVRIVKGMQMIDFRHNGTRYRLTTIYTEDQPITKGEKLLSAIKLDLERGQFRLNNYIRQIPNIKIMSGLSLDYIEPTDTGHLLRQQIERYKNRKDLTEESIYALQLIINKYLVPYFDRVELSSITVHDLEQFISTLNVGRDRIKAILRPMREMYKYAKRANLIKDNPFDSLEPKTLTKYSNDENQIEKDPFTVEELEKILSACDNQPVIKNMIQTCFWTGVRLGELFAMTWSNIDFENDVIHITHSSTSRGTLKLPKTKAGIRDIEMTPKAKEALLEQFKITGENKIGRVFLTNTGLVWKRPSYFGEKFWQPLLKKSGVKYRNPYQLRHSFISYMLMQGNNPMILYRMVGHETPQVIFKYYARYISKTGKKLLIVG